VLLLLLLALASSAIATAVMQVNQVKFITFLAVLAEASLPFVEAAKFHFCQKLNWLLNIGEEIPFSSSIKNLSLAFKCQQICGDASIANS